MTAIELDSIRFEVEHRNVGGGGGPTLRVCARADDRELLRFDCFERGAHWHVDPSGRDEITPLADDVDPLAWTLGELRRDLAGYLARAALEADFNTDAGARAAALARVEKAMRAG